MSKNVLVLPEELPRKAPTCWQKELWFDDEKHDWRTDYDIENALIVHGIGERQCPTVSKWVAFSIAGAIVARLTGKYIVPPEEPLPFNWDLEQHIWEALWQAVQENQTKLNKVFMAAMLRSFIPRQHHAPPERPYCMSAFAAHWLDGERSDTLYCSVSNLRLECIKQGREAMTRLSQEVVTSINEVAEHVPSMLEIAIKRIRRTYQW
jgi:hypothetical protein